MYTRIRIRIHIHIHIHIRIHIHILHCKRSNNVRTFSQALKSLRIFILLKLSTYSYMAKNEIKSLINRYSKGQRCICEEHLYAQLF